MAEPNVFVFDDDLLDSEIDALFDEAIVVQITERGIGLCLHVPCEDYLKPAWLMKYEGPFICGKCSHTGRIVEERGIPQHRPGQLYGEIRVEFNYCPAKDKYCAIAIIRDNSLGDDVAVYTAQMPHIHTEKRALKVAQALLSIMNDGLMVDDPHQVPRTYERILNLDQSLDGVKDWCRGFESRLRDNPFYQSLETE